MTRPLTPDETKRALQFIFSDEIEEQPVGHLTKLFQTMDHVETDPNLTSEQKRLQLQMQVKNLAFCLLHGIVPVVKPQQHEAKKP